MRTWSLLLLVLVVLVALGALVALGLFGPEPAEDPAGGGDRTEAPQADEELIALYGPEPDDRPEIVAPEVTEPLGVLMLVGATQRFNAFLALQWGQDPNVTIRSWVAPLPREAAGTGSFVEPLRGAIGAPPTASFFEEEDVDVLVLNDIDPSAIEDGFWLEVTRRVEEGRLGLLVMPDLLHGRAMFEHPMVGPLLPVTSIRKIEGQPAPGVFGRLAPFDVTPDGERHPASRLVPWPRWSRAIWKSTREGEFAWGARFCDPVDEVAPEASVLLRVDPARGDGYPALIVGPSNKGRVLWFGAREMGVGDAYGRPSTVRQWDALIHGWLTWLAGRLTK